MGYRRRIAKTPSSPDEVMRAVQQVHSGALADDASLAGNGDGTYSIKLRGVQAKHMAQGMPIGIVTAGGLSISDDGYLSITSPVGVVANSGLTITAGNQLSQIGEAIFAADEPTPADGGLWYNQTTKSFRGQTGGVLGDEWRVLSVNAAVSNDVTNTAIETNFTTGYTPPANWFTVGRALRFRGGGTLQCNATETLQIKIYCGSALLYDFGARAVAVTGVGGKWHFDVTMICATTGTTGTIGGFAYLNVPAHSAAGTQYIPSTITPQTVNTTVANLITLSAKWSAAATQDHIAMQANTVEGT